MINLHLVWVVKLSSSFHLILRVTCHS